MPGSAEVCWRSPRQIDEETSTSAQSSAGPQNNHFRFPKEHHLIETSHLATAPDPPAAHRQHLDHVFLQGNKVWGGDREVTE